MPALRLPARQALRINFSQRLKAGISGEVRALKPHEMPAFAGMTIENTITPSSG